MKHQAIWKYIYIVLFLSFGIQNAVADKEKRNFTLVIDAGHGGHDGGAKGAFSKEKNINLAVALAFGRLVEENCPDVKVIYTRKRDVFIPLQRRADIANSNHADLFISIHTNALPKGAIAYGSETYTLGMARASANLEVAKRENSVITLEDNYQQTYKGFNPNKAESYVIFELMQDRYMKQSVDLARSIQRQYRSAGRPDKGVHQAGFLVLRNTSMPSVLTELGFISTPSEERYLNSASGQQELSRSIYNGFLAYRRQHDRRKHDLPADLPLKQREAAQRNKDEKVANENKSNDNDRAQSKSTRQSAKDESASRDVAVVPVNVTPTSQLRQPARRSDDEARNEDSKSQVQVSLHNEKADSSNLPQTDNQPKHRTADAPAAKSTPRTKSAPRAINQPRNSEKTERKTKEKRPMLGNVVTYCIQLAAGTREISPRDPQFKGLAVTRVKEGNLFKYYHGSFKTYAEAHRAMPGVLKKMPDAYMVAFLNGQKVTVKQARAAERK